MTMDFGWMHSLKVVCIFLAAASFVIYFVLVEYRSHKRNNAPVETARAAAYCKHPDMEPVLTGRSSTYVYYITFHTNSGDILKLYMTPQDYYSISEGSWGILTWQHNKFWKFQKEE